MDSTFCIKQYIFSETILNQIVEGAFYTRQLSEQLLQSSTGKVEEEPETLFPMTTDQKSKIEEGNNYLKLAGLKFYKFGCIRKRVQKNFFDQSFANKIMKA